MPILPFSISARVRASSPRKSNREVPLNKDVSFVTGISLRDWFAGQAIVGLIANGVVRNSKQVAADAYTVADRMIQAASNAPVNHVGMAVVLEDLPPLMWHAELGKSLRDHWIAETNLQTALTGRSPSGASAVGAAKATAASQAAGP